MADLKPIDRLQPCLLDRLTADKPREQADYRYERYVSLQQYRAGVERDLEWLLNSKARLGYSKGDRMAPDRIRLALGSVINFGVSPIIGLSAVRVDDVRDRVTEAIRRFEPRIAPSSLEVSVRKEDGELTLRIRGVLWANPLPESFDVRSRIDLESGRCVLGGAGHG